MKFRELSDEQKKKALEKYRYTNVDYDGWDENERYEFITKMKEYGFDEINLLVDTSCTQGSGASFDTESVDIEKFLRKTKRWSKYRPLQEMIRIKDIDCTITRATYPHYVHSNMVSANLPAFNVELTPVQEEYCQQLEKEITEFVQSESDSIHSVLENLMLELMSDEAVQDTIESNDYDFMILESDKSYI